MLRAYAKFALRAEFKAKTARAAWFGRAALWRWGFAWVWPPVRTTGIIRNLAKISDVGTVLTPEERQKAVEDSAEAEPDPHKRRLKEHGAAIAPRFEPK